MQPMRIEAERKLLQPEDTIPKGKYDYVELSRLRDRIKSHVFMSKGAAFYGPIMSGCEFWWSTECDTACTDGLRIWWNPDFFLQKSEKFNQFVMMHEVSHVANLHMLRQDYREGEPWNWACDIRINNDLVKQGYSFEDFPAWFNPGLDRRPEGAMAEEEIYDWIIGNGINMGPNPWGTAEFQAPNSSDIEKQINNVQKGIANAKDEFKVEEIPGNLETIIDHFLAPILPWEQLLDRWMTERGGSKMTWRRPRRRLLTHDLYLPSRQIDQNELTHLIYMQDVSGSITVQEIERFNSELKHVWEKFKPKRMTIVLFDAIIQKVYEFKQGDGFHSIEITGRGGNDMNPVADWLDACEPTPTAAIIFSDLQYTPMRPLKHQIPVLWINSGPELPIPYGEVIRISVKQGRIIHGPRAA